MTTYPKRKDLFTAWSKAMVEGATVDKPNYGKTSRSPRKKRSQRAGKRRRRNNAKKE